MWPMLSCRDEERHPMRGEATGSWNGSKNDGGRAKVERGETEYGRDSAYISHFRARWQTWQTSGHGKSGFSVRRGGHRCLPAREVKREGHADRRAAERA